MSSTRNHDFFEHENSFLAELTDFNMKSHTYSRNHDYFDHSMISIMSRWFPQELNDFLRLPWFPQRCWSIIYGNCHGGLIDLGTRMGGYSHVLGNAIWPSSIQELQWGDIFMFHVMGPARLAARASGRARGSGGRVRRAGGSGSRMLLPLHLVRRRIAIQYSRPPGV